jgi:hypothetical protein
LKAPGFNPWAYEMKTWFQSLLFQILILYRYRLVLDVPGGTVQLESSWPTAGKAPGFNPWAYEARNWFQRTHGIAWKAPGFNPWACQVISRFQSALSNATCAAYSQGKWSEHGERTGWGAVQLNPSDPPELWKRLLSNHDPEIVISGLYL